MRRKALQILKEKKKMSTKQIKPKIIKTFFHQDSQDLQNISQRIHIHYSPSFLERHKSQLIITAIQADIPQLSSPQLSNYIKMFIINKKADKQLGWHSQEYSQKQDFNQYINPQILRARNPQIDQELNVSFPLFNTRIYRFQSIDVQYQLINRQKRKQTLTGFKARLFQQNYDFLNGKNILDWRLHHGNIHISKDSLKYFPKTSEILQSYSSQIRDYIVEYPNLVQIPQQVDKKWLKMDSQELSIERDNIRRINKYYTKQMLILLQKAEIGLIN